MLKWLRRLLKSQKQIVKSNSLGIQAGDNCNIGNSFNGKNIKSDNSIEIIDDEVWVDDKRIK